MRLSDVRGSLWPRAIAALSLVVAALVGSVGATSEAAASASASAHDELILREPLLRGAPAALPGSRAVAPTALGDELTPAAGAALTAWSGSAVAQPLIARSAFVAEPLDAAHRPRGPPQLDTARLGRACA